jgi:hypothetical protein
VLPATAEPDGYLAAKERGRLVRVAPEGVFRCTLRFGAMDADMAAKQEGMISRVRAAGT